MAVDKSPGKSAEMYVVWNDSQLERVCLGLISKAYLLGNHTINAIQIILLSVHYIIAVAHNLRSLGCVFPPVKRFEYNS